MIINGRNINYQNSFGDTPLLRATCSNNPEIVKLLVNNEANIKIKISQVRML